MKEVKIFRTMHLSHTEPQTVWYSFLTHVCACVFAESLMLGTEVDLQQVENTVFAIETVFKAWLQEQGGDREHLHLLLPSPMDNLIPG